MKKRKIRKKKQWNENRKRWISLNFLGSYLLILLAPAIAVVAVYCTARNAMVETQKERIQSAVNEVGVSFNREIKEAQNAGYYVGKEKRLSSYLMKARPDGERAGILFPLYDFDHLSQLCPDESGHQERLRSGFEQPVSYEDSPGHPADGDRACDSGGLSLWQL